MIVKKNDLVTSLNCTAHSPDSKLCAVLSLALWGTIETLQQHTQVKFDIVKAEPKTATVILDNFSNWTTEGLIVMTEFLVQLQLIKESFGEDSFTLDVIEE